MAEDVVQRRDQSDNAQDLVAGADENHGQAEAGENDADVLDRAVGQQALEVVAQHRVQHPEQGRGRADDQQHQPPLPLDVADQVIGDADQPVDRHLEHDTAHERGDVRRRHRMRFRQPRVQRHHAGLHAEAEEGEREGDRGPGGGEFRRAHGAEGEPAAEAGEHAETQQDRQPADVRHQQVQKRRAPVGGVLVLIRHQEIARDRHQLPRDHEHEGVVREQDQQHAEDEQAGEQAERRKRLAVFRVGVFAQVAGGEQADGEHQQADHGEEESGKRVEPQMPFEPRQAERQQVRRGHLVDQGPGAGEDRQHAADTEQDGRAVTQQAGITVGAQCQDTGGQSAGQGQISESQGRQAF